MSTTILTKEHKRQQVILHDPVVAAKTNFSTIRRKRVAAYARVSTELDSQQNSYETQIDYYTNYIQNHPDWEFVQVYADEGVTGTSYKRRDGFNRMVEDAMLGKIDLILTKSISRFARNTVDALTITRQLKSENIEVYFEKENISSMDAQAELIFTIMSSIAQEESRSISQNVRWGLLRSMEAGKITLPWKSFLGFTKGADGLPQIVESEAKIVRQIYRNYLDGMTLQSIARSLIRRNIKTARQKERWTAEAVRHILTNEKYKGDAILQKTYTVDFLSKEVRVNNGERKQWYIRDSHDAIITPEAFQLVQAELKRRGGARGRHFESPFTGNLYCGVCGSFCGHHTRFASKNSTRGTSVWICNHNNKHGIAAEMSRAMVCSGCGGFHKGVCGQSGVCRTPIVEDKKIRRAFVIAFKRLLRDYKINWSKFEQNFATFSFTPEIYQKIANFSPHFNERAWHTLVEFAEILPNNLLKIHFRNRRVEAVNLVDC